MNELDYKKAGVDIDKADKAIETFLRFQKTRPSHPSILGGIGPYASCFSLKPWIEKCEDPVLVTSCDGVGTKVKLAFDWGKTDTLGQDLVGMNVNDLLCVGARPLLFLDYFATGKLNSTMLGELLKSIQLACEQAQCFLVGGETAEMPGVYQGEEFDLAGFTVGIVDRKNVLGAEKVIIGDRILALASSGFHSSGYSLVRKVIEKEKLKPEGKAPEGMGTWKEVLLAPTTFYIAPLLPHLGQIHALAHITGGGLLENVPRVLPKNTVARIHKKHWPLNALFKWFQSKTKLSDQEFLTTFNCGVGMVAIGEEKQLEKLIGPLERVGIKAWFVGSVEKSSKAEPHVDWIES